MNQSKKSIVLVTGAGTGIGNLSARTLAAAGHTVYASMRDVEGRNASKAKALQEYAAVNGYKIKAVELDVLSQESADRAVQTIIKEQGQLDVVMHNAGHLVVGVVEAFSPEEMVKVFDTNVLGTQRVNRAALPYMRAQQSGLLLWISSTTVRGGFPPFLGPYVAAKAAMDSLAQTMAYEVAKFGIETSFVVPGAFTQGTSHFPSAGHPQDEKTSAAYDRINYLLDEVGDRLSALTPPEADPQAVADEVARIVGLPAGSRPARSVIDFVNDGAAEVTELSEKLRIEFLHRIGLEELLKPAVLQ
ncbi:SDR family oxidoreductase [Paenibacillus rhizophilus]|uniref:SDR family oxidoreductase n=1 Tax=Paenibacillus rhizophilus TaxID=1850366 RepID=A0A3N9PVE5_9BACL|nr:SDR family oxidoreductase [Paenibacillus rhizophilus]RQW09226.1 SDR family oxidoreductase [Paenibacillus rhizophilus]